MFNITTSLDAIVAAEKIASSHRLLDDEKITLLTTLRDTIAIDLECLPPHALIASTAISRMIQNEQRDAPGTTGKAAKQGRKAKGIEDKASVAAEGAEEATEAPEGPTEGVQEPA